MGRLPLRRPSSMRPRRQMRPAPRISSGTVAMLAALGAAFGDQLVADPRVRPLTVPMTFRAGGVATDLAPAAAEELSTQRRHPHRPAPHRRGVRPRPGPPRVVLGSVLPRRRSCGGHHSPDCALHDRAVHRRLGRGARRAARSPGRRLAGARHAHRAGRALDGRPGHPRRPGRSAARGTRWCPMSSPSAPRTRGHPWSGSPPAVWRRRRPSPWRLRSWPSATSAASASRSSGSPPWRRHRPDRTGTWWQRRCAAPLRRGSSGGRARASSAPWATAWSA